MYALFIHTHMQKRFFFFIPWTKGVSGLVMVDRRPLFIKRREEESRVLGAAAAAADDDRPTKRIMMAVCWLLCHLKFTAILTG